MRKSLIGVALAALVAFGVGVAAHAGGNGAVKADLYVAQWFYLPAPRPPVSRIVDPPVAVGHAVFNTTANGMMNVTVALKDGAPNTGFEVVALPGWGVVGGFTTNGSGKATMHASVALPAGAEGTVGITLSVRPARGVPPVYRTFEATVPVK